MIFLEVYLPSKSYKYVLMRKINTKNYINYINHLLINLFDYNNLLLTQFKFYF
jgi:hypothetical protein